MRSNYTGLSAEKAAVKTLDSLNYTYHGSELWKPPIGKTIADKPEFNKEFCVRGGSDDIWFKCKIVFVGKRYTVVENENGKEFSRKSANIRLRDIDTRTDEEKARADILKVDQEVHESIKFEHEFLDAIKAGKIHNVTWSK